MDKAKDKGMYTYHIYIQFLVEGIWETLSRESEGSKNGSKN